MRLVEEDFEVLREPLESGRQSRESLSASLILGIFIQALMFSLNYFMIGDITTFPYNEEIINIHFWITASLIGLSLLYSIPFVYKRSERIQYLLVIVVSHNMSSIPLLIMSLFLIGLKDEGMTTNEGTLLKIATITLGIGLFLFVATFVRFYILLKKGQYRKGSKKEEQRSELATMAFFPRVALLCGIGLVLITKYISKNSNYYDSNSALLIVGGIFLFFVMIVILPEQLVILYCKYKYKSFNFNERGYLYSSENQNDG
ncbi:hypothetical protein MKX96_15370 [Psychrobacillus sp. FSL W7-1493]|uniref:hypothetical protein n=1 Tax=Psychrobacillus sp. FSL W7-1493 TaxID=2921552 RepID=UPI0030F5B9EC